MSSDETSRERKRTTISLTSVVDSLALEMMKKKGYDNFSAYVADLIRRDKEREEGRQISKKTREREADENRFEDDPKKGKAG